MTAATLLPHLTASLNALTVGFLLAGLYFIRRRRRDAHRRAMLGALTVSTLFLAAYAIYHFSAPIFVFAGQGPVRPLYYGLLVSHVVLSAVVLPLVLLTLARALRGRFEVHRGIARWTLPLWLYVSVSGIAVYVMLYHLYRPAA